MTFEDQLYSKINSKTKPLGALGRLEEIAFQIGKIQKSLSPQLMHPSILVFAGDHGLADESVSAYPKEVTPQMVLNFLSEGAAINVFCRQNNIDLKIIDAGVNFDFEDHPRLIRSKAGYGTQNSLKGKAMSEEELNFCIHAGKEIASEIISQGCNIIGFGEMGIGNTSSASLIMSMLYDLPVELCTGKGTGLSEDQLDYKKRILSDVLKLHPETKDPFQILQAVGGFEIAQMTGAMLASYDNNCCLLIDGFIASSAIALAARIQPGILNNCIFCHVSDEEPHRRLLELLGHTPLLQLQLRVGEGTGCALAYPLIQNAVNFLNEMASFETAGVSNKTQHD